MVCIHSLIDIQATLYYMLFIYINGKFIESHTIEKHKLKVYDDYIIIDNNRLVKVIDN